MRMVVTCVTVSSLACSSESAPGSVSPDGQDVDVAVEDGATSEGDGGLTPGQARCQPTTTTACEGGHQKEVPCCGAGGASGCDLYALGWKDCGGGTCVGDSESCPGDVSDSGYQPCESNDDCDSGYCVPFGDGRVCTEHCLDDCPGGWECTQATNAGGDATFICLPLEGD